ncbi:phage portal protein [Epibacterium ulvae]|uniref:portal protein n=1 Tax=Epibacterium ulvae TaxID=1156985 RepID=UPI001BFC4E81|nr:phage portal protein [Epibacterium ulvae]MBT8152744.1 phage portal protein [Epibacterium ulvae]
MSDVVRLVDQCERHLDQQAGDRERALEYYNGEIRDLPVEADEDGVPLRSSVVSRDFRDTVKKIMPSVMRAILSNDQVVEYEPKTPESEESAEQATKYVNAVVVPECGAEKAIHDAIHDAFTVKTGILKWAAYKNRRSETTEHSNLSEEAMLGLIGEDDELIDHEEAEETDQEVLALIPNARRHSFKLKRAVDRIDVRLEAVPRGSFLIHPDAETIEDSPIVGERQEISRSELVSRGYDRGKVDKLSAYRKRADDDTDDHARKGDDYSYADDHKPTALELVQIYEVYALIDRDGDGIAEMYKIVYGESGERDTTGGGEGQSARSRIVLEDEAVSEAPYAEVICERDAHQFEGHSIFEDTEDIQRIKTSLTRGVLDNVYWQNNPSGEVDLNGVENPDAVFNPRFGQMIRRKGGNNGVPVVQLHQIPFYAAEAFAMLPHWDEVVKDRTGITDASGGLDPEQIANVNSSVAQLAADSGTAQAEMIIRTLARGGIEKAFRGLLKLVVAHHDQERTIKVSGAWVSYNPKSWDADLDCTVNVGLGAGSRERDLSVLQTILGLQREVIAAFGPDNPFVKPTQLYRTLAKIAETAGFPSADPYFTAPNDEEVKAKLAAQQEQPDPQRQKIEMQMQLEQAKAQARQQVEQAQMQADLAVKDAERRAQMEIETMKAQLAYMQHQQKLELEYAKAGLAPPGAASAGLPEQVFG